MSRRFVALLLFVLTLGSGSAYGKGWTFSGGLGLTISPELFLVNPQLEYQHNARLFYGPMVQIGAGSGGALFTTSGTLRYLLGNHPRFKPAVEGGLGLAVASSLFADELGVHVMLGMGFDYKIDNTISLGTMIRANFAPPLKTFFISWPIFLGRFAI